MYEKQFSVSVLGLGNLGFAIAKKLLEANFTVKVWNRTAGKANELTKLGAIEASSLLDAVETDGIIISVLADDPALESIISYELLSKLSKGLHISMSTISPDLSIKLAERHKNAGSGYVAAPIFARPEAILAKVGNVCMSGEADSKLKAKPILEALAKGVFDFGEKPAAANVVKLAGNFMIAASIEMMSEAYVFAEKNGVNRHDIHEMLSQTLFDSPIFQNYGKMIAANNYEPVSFKLPLGLKDIKLTLQAAENVGVSMPMADIARNRFIAAIAKGRENMDWSAFALGAQEDAGLIKQ